MLKFVQNEQDRKYFRKFSASCLVQEDTNKNKNITSDFKVPSVLPKKDSYEFVRNTRSTKSFSYTGPGRRPIRRLSARLKKTLEKIDTVSIVSVNDAEFTANMPKILIVFRILHGTGTPIYIDFILAIFFCISAQSVPLHMKELILNCTEIIHA